MLIEQTRAERTFKFKLVLTNLKAKVKPLKYGLYSFKIKILLVQQLQLLNPYRNTNNKIKHISQKIPSKYGKKGSITPGDIVQLKIMLELMAYWRESMVNGESDSGSTAGAVERVKQFQQRHFMHIALLFLFDP